MIRELSAFGWPCVVCFALLLLARSASGQCPADEVRIKASDPDPFDSFGRAVSISGDTVVVGAFWDDQTGADSGAAYLFQFNGSNWAQRDKFVASDAQGNDWLGYTVANQGDTALIGALQHDHDGESGNGPVYVFRRDKDTWEWAEVQELMASDGASGDGFSFAIALSGDSAVIGAPAHDENGTNSGSAYVFGFDGSEWVEEQELLASDPTFSDSFGLAVAISGGTVVIGAHGHVGVNPESPICNSGAAYVFRFNEETNIWEEETKLTASDAACGNRFGGAVSVSGQTVLIGADLHQDNGFGSGAAYVFRFDPASSQWVEAQKLLPSDGVRNDAFGDAVAMDGDLAVIGARFATDAGSNAGAAYVFRRNALGVWVEQCKLLPEPNPWTQFFGRSIDMDGRRVIIGASGEDQQQGAAYIFELSFNPADLDADGDVDAFDLALLLGNWGPCDAPCTPGDPAQTCPADLDADGTVGPPDLAILLGAWGPCE